MRKLVIGILVGFIIGYFAIQLYTVNKNKVLPYGIKIGTEDFRGTKVDILTDGRGGEVRWVANVPWNKFTAKEKMRMASNDGGWLSIKDLIEIWLECGAWRKLGQFQDLEIKLIKPGE